MIINSGAFWGLITVIGLSIIITKVRKKRAERRWKKYGEEKIFRPDEWARRDRGRESGIGEREGRNSSESIATEQGINSGTSEETSSRGIIQRSNFQDKSSSDASTFESNSKGNSDIVKTSKWSGCTIPSVEPIN